MQYTTKIGADPHIDLYVLLGHSWILDNPLLGVQGQWHDGSPLHIEFINDFDYDPVWTNINFIYPEPATLALLGIGSSLLRKRKKHRPERTCPLLAGFSKSMYIERGFLHCRELLCFFTRQLQFSRRSGRVCKFSNSGFILMTIQNF